MMLNIWRRKLFRETDTACHLVLSIGGGHGWCIACSSTWPGSKAYLGTVPMHDDNRCVTGRTIPRNRCAILSIKCQELGFINTDFILSKNDTNKSLLDWRDYYNKHMSGTGTSILQRTLAHRVKSSSTSGISWVCRVALVEFLCPSMLVRSIGISVVQPRLSDHYVNDLTEYKLKCKGAEAAGSANRNMYLLLMAIKQTDSLILRYILYANKQIRRLMLQSISPVLSSAGTLGIE